MIPVEAWAPAGAVLVALIGLLGTLLVRERRRNHSGNPDTPGASVTCPYADGRIRVALTEETVGILRDIKGELAGVRTAVSNQGSTLGYIMGRLGDGAPRS